MSNYTYQLLANSASVQRSDGVFIPNDPCNADWQQYQAWIADGGVPTPVPAPPAPTAAQLLAQAQAAQIATLQASYKAAINTPVSFKNAAGVTSTYPAGDTVALNGATAMQNLQRALDAGSTAWTLGKWLDTNNVDQTFTYADLQGLAAAMAAVQTLDWQDLVAKVAKVNAATTVSAVQAITF